MLKWDGSMIGKFIPTNKFNDLAGGVSGMLVYFIVVTFASELFIGFWVPSRNGQFMSVGK